MAYTLSITKPFPLLGLQPGDILIVEPGAPEPVVLYRALPPNFGAVLGILQEEAGEPLSPELSFAELAAVVGQSALFRPAPGGDGAAPVRRAPFAPRPRMRRLK